MPIFKISAALARKLNPRYQSMDSDHNLRTWKYLGFGTKTSPNNQWKQYRDEGNNAKGPWLYSAPYGMVLYKQDRLDIYFDDMRGKQTNWVHIGKADGICNAPWMILAHFYTHVAPHIRVDKV